MTEYSIYKKFHEQERVEALAQFLKENAIDFEISEDRDSLDSLYGHNQFNKQFFIKIKKEDFSKADAILLSTSEKELESVDKSHYLYEFTDEELFDIISKPDEWNEFDFQLARKLLSERGKEINNETIELLKKQRISELAKPEDSSKVWIYAGYIFSLLGGLLGIFMGLALVTTKKTLPNGQKVYTYSAEHRSHGKRILIIGIIMLLISLMIKIATTEY